MKLITLTQSMKSMTLLFILPFGFVTSIYAQEAKDEKTEGEVKIKIITSVNGDTKTVEKTFQPGDVYMLEQLNDSFPEIRAMAKAFTDSPSVFFYNFSYDLETEMENLGEEIEQLGEEMEIKWDSEAFEKEMEKLGKEMKVEWNSEEFQKEMQTMSESIARSMEGMKHGLAETIIIDGDEIRTAGEDGERVTVSEDGDTIKISVRKEIKIGEDADAENRTDRKVKVIVIEEETDGKESEEPEIKVIKKVIKVNDQNGTAGVAEATEDAALRVYPNPSSGKITVNFKPGSKKKTQLKVTDEAGKVVYSEELKSASEISHEIDLGNEAKGIYFVELVQGKNKFVSRIMLK